MESIFILSIVVHTWNQDSRGSCPYVCAKPSQEPSSISMESGEVGSGGISGVRNYFSLHYTTLKKGKGRKVEDKD